MAYPDLDSLTNPLAADPAFLPLIVSPAPAEDDGDDLLLMVAVMRSRLRL